MGQMPVQGHGQHIHRVGQPAPVVVNAVVVNAVLLAGVHGLTDRGQQRIDLLVLGLHGVEHRPGRVAGGQPLPQRGPDQLVLGGVVDVQLPLEHHPAPLHGFALGGSRPGRSGRRAGQPHHVPAQRLVRGQHDGQIRVPGSVPGRIGPGQFARCHGIPCKRAPGRAPYPASHP